MVTNAQGCSVMPATPVLELTGAGYETQKIVRRPAIATTSLAPSALSTMRLRSCACCSPLLLFLRATCRLSSAVPARRCRTPLQAYAAAGAWRAPNGTVTSVAFGGQCEPGMQVLAPDAATPGWDGCAARGGARVYALWLGMSVWHSVRRPPSCGRPSHRIVVLLPRFSPRMMR